MVVQKEAAAPDASTSVLIYDLFERAGVVSTQTANRAFQVRQSYWLAQQEVTIALGAIERSDLIDKIRANSVLLENCCEFCLGLTPYDKYSGHTPEQISNKVFHATAQLDASYKRLCRAEM